MTNSSLVPSTPEDRMLRNAARKIGEKYGHSYFTAQAREGRKASELYTELGAAGFLGVHLPEEYGGSGAGLLELCAVIEEVSAAGCPLLMMVISPAICGSILAAYGSHELKKRWLPGIANGSSKMCFAVTEPDSGSNTHNVSTTARVGSNGWSLNGAKYYISGIDEADAVLVVARDEALSTPDRQKLSLFVVPTDALGLSYQIIETELVQPEKQFTVFFDGVPLAAEALIGEAGNGLKQVFAGLNAERITAASISNGISRYALDKATSYARERSVWSTPIGAHQGIAHPLAEAYINMQLSRLMTARAAELADAGESAGEAANIAKFSAAEASLKALDQAIQTHGGNGFSREYGLADLWFLARMLRTAPVSREMVLNFVAQHSLDLPRSY
jgi:alkylation response protein AidB-like acyl-CoA dehydrogenase